MANILVVDDEPDIRMMLHIALSASGHDAILAPDGETGLVLAQADGIDCMLLDMMMPVMDGLGVLEGLANLPDPPPVVVISARSEDRDVLRALTAGAVDYVTKPFDLNSLVALVEEVAYLDQAGRAAHRDARLARVR